MLGVQDFCGYYDWSFHHVRRHFGESALQELWSIAIGIDSQRHYVENGRRDGLKGLYHTWNRTGEDEKCDWTFTLDESANVLRWDMRRCPSKGFLIDNNLHTDEDYCDHCIGWVKTSLGVNNMEMVHHEHNHCGQCWGEMRVKGKPFKSLRLDCDIRRDPRWNAGFIDEFVDQQKVAAHPSDVLRQWLGGRTLVVVEDPLAFEPGGDHEAACVSAEVYVRSRLSRSAVLIESPPVVSTLMKLSAKLKLLAPADQPLLMYPFLPKALDVRFVEFGLPRPLPVLPMLIRAGVDAHDRLVPSPTTVEWMHRIVASVGM